MRTCSRCKETKPLDGFTTFKTGRVACWCKRCRSLAATEYQKAHPERHRQLTREHKDRNREATRRQNTEYRAKNRGLVREGKRRYMAMRLSALAAATPPWADLKAIKEFYRNCPEGFSVDHIIPIRHPLVCGLHVIENLQYIPIRANVLKSNSFDGTAENRGWQAAIFTGAICPRTTEIST